MSTRMTIVIGWFWMSQFNTASIISLVENGDWQTAIKLWDLMENFFKITGVSIFYLKGIE